MMGRGKNTKQRFVYPKCVSGNRLSFDCFSGWSCRNMVMITQAPCYNCKFNSWYSVKFHVSSCQYICTDQEYLEWSCHPRQYIFNCLYFYSVFRQMPISLLFLSLFFFPFNMHPKYRKAVRWIVQIQSEGPSRIFVFYPFLSWVSVYCTVGIA